VSGEPDVVERAAALLHALVADGGNPVTPNLFLTGAFYFCLMYTGSNVRPIARLLAATHRWSFLLLGAGHSTHNNKNKDSYLISNPNP
jgi:hypothetical protein